MNLITTFILFYICFSLFRIKLECQRFILESGWKGKCKKVTKKGSKNKEWKTKNKGWKVKQDLALLRKK